MADEYTVEEGFLKTRCGVEQPGSSSGSIVDSKLRADIAESAVITELLARGHRVLQPVGDRLPYDVAIDLAGGLIKIQVKHAWYDAQKDLFLVDARRTKTNRRCMKRAPYTSDDFDFAIVYLGECKVFYVLPVAVFTSFVSSISFVEGAKRQRPPKTAAYKERWDLLSTQGSSVGNG